MTPPRTSDAGPESQSRAWDEWLSDAQEELACARLAVTLNERTLSLRRAAAAIEQAQAILEPRRRGR